MRLAKISRLLVAMDQGTIAKLKGKSLDEMNVNMQVEEAIPEEIQYFDDEVINQYYITI